MSSVGIRELRQSASAVVARAAAGETITITDRGRPVAQIGPRTPNGLRALREQGLVREPRASAADLLMTAPLPDGTPSLGELLEDDREERLT